MTNDNNIFEITEDDINEFLKKHPDVNKDDIIKWLNMYEKVHEYRIQNPQILDELSQNYSGTNPFCYQQMLRPDYPYYGHYSG